LASSRITGSALPDQRLTFLGAGAAGIGIARLVRSAMREAGMDDGAVRRGITMLDSRGLLVEGREGVEAEKAEFALTPAEAAALGVGGGDPLDRVVEAFHPTVLIGTTGIAGAFSERVIRQMAVHAEAPVVFPLSNPTSLSEATPVDVANWSEGRALVATGSPFAPVPRAGGEQLIGQANNAFIFPGLGLGAIVAEIPSIPDHLFLAAANELASVIGSDRLATGALYPPPSWLREISKRIAIRVALESAAGGYGRRFVDADAVERAVDDAMWFPEYLPYVPA
jgi:malate dehydrogenase (oxaloacetate-decarboxylating)